MRRSYPTGGGSSLPPSPGVGPVRGESGRELLARLELPGPWAGDTAAALHLIDELDAEITTCEPALRRLGADHRYVPLLMTTPGVGWVLGYTMRMSQDPWNLGGGPVIIRRL